MADPALARQVIILHRRAGMGKICMPDKNVALLGIERHDAAITMLRLFSDVNAPRVVGVGAILGRRLGRVDKRHQP